MTVKAAEEDMFLLSQLLSKQFFLSIKIQKNYFQGKMAYVLSEALFVAGRRF